MHARMTQPPRTWRSDLTGARLVTSSEFQRVGGCPAMLCYMCCAVLIVAYCRLVDVIYVCSVFTEEGGQALISYICLVQSAVVLS